MIELPVISQSGAVQRLQAIPPRPDQPFVSGTLRTSVGMVPKVESGLTGRDRWGSMKARWGVWRMNYKIDPGLYALGSPHESSEVLISANYKLSFDELRSALPERNAWILVMDTRGINVWCAAGKGTFGTEELIYRIQTSGIKEVAQKGRLIVPQLGAPGVSAHEVRKRTGFKVHYGPVRASDLPAYLDAGFKASPGMRKVAFGLKDRATLIPLELSIGLKPFVLIALVFLTLATAAGYAAGDLSGVAGLTQSLRTEGLFAVAALGAAILAGAVLHPVLLPYLPARAFSLQGAMVGLVVAVALLYWRGGNLHAWPGLLEALAWLLIIPSVAAYLAMNFTGSSTYTSLSGVKKEMRIALPAEIAGIAAGGVLWMGSLIAAWRNWL